MAYRIVLADDHPLTLVGLADALGVFDEIEIVARASDGIRAISLIKAKRPDCAVLDLSMPGATGLEVMIEARRWSPETRFVLVTGNSAPNILQALHAAGAQGLFLKSAPVADICDAILRVASGEHYVAPAVQSILDAAGDTVDLTSRERQVLQAIARGLTNQAASSALGISVKTIDTHRTNLMRKLGVHSTASLVVRAMRDGLIDVSDID